MNEDDILNYDTDSVIYLTQPGQVEPQLGNYIGDLTDELGGDYITVFASGGSKNYCYKTNGDKTEIKVRGITLAQRRNKQRLHSGVSSVPECQPTSGAAAMLKATKPEEIL